MVGSRNKVNGVAMPPPIKVELLPHDPGWASRAAAESRVLAAVIGPGVTAIHHVGSTAIPEIRAKPILELMPVLARHADLERRRAEIEAIGYVWHGEYGLPGRRYCTKSDAVTGARLVHLHCYEDRHPDIARTLAFRDYLRTHREIAAAYEAEKLRCQCLHVDSSHAYADCKSGWIKKTEADALRWCAAR